MLQSLLFIVFLTVTRAGNQLSIEFDFDSAESDGPAIIAKSRRPTPYECELPELPRDQSSFYIEIQERDSWLMHAMSIDPEKAREIKVTAIKKETGMYSHTLIIPKHVMLSALSRSQRHLFPEDTLQMRFRARRETDWKTVTGKLTLSHQEATTPNTRPTAFPTAAPTNCPTKIPSAHPTTSPTANPTQSPTVSQPTSSPTANPTTQPTSSPTDAPTRFPTQSPTVFLTQSPTEIPTHATTRLSTLRPTASPTEPPKESLSTSRTSADEQLQQLREQRVRRFATNRSTCTASPTMHPTASPIRAQPSTANTGRISPDEQLRQFREEHARRHGQHRTNDPTESPTQHPTLHPTRSPTTPQPTYQPTSSRRQYTEQLFPDPFGRRRENADDPQMAEGIRRSRDEYERQQRERSRAMRDGHEEQEIEEAARRSMETLEEDERRRRAGGGAAEPREPTAHPTQVPIAMRVSLDGRNPRERRRAEIPTANPTRSPTVRPSTAPTLRPSVMPTNAPTIRLRSQGDGSGGAERRDDEMHALTLGFGVVGVLFAIAGIVGLVVYHCHQRKMRKVSRGTGHLRMQQETKLNVKTETTVVPVAGGGGEAQAQEHENDE